MIMFFTEESYENSLIDLFENNLQYQHVYGPNMKEIFIVLYTKMF